MNHAVLYVRDARRTQQFYEEVLGFSTIIDHPTGGYVFMRAQASANHHDIAFFSIGEQAAASEAGRRTVGMYVVEEGRQPQADASWNVVRDSSAIALLRAFEPDSESAAFELTRVDVLIGWSHVSNPSRGPRSSRGNHWTNVRSRGRRSGRRGNGSRRTR